MYEYLRIAAIIAVCMVASKAIIGYHFPWEKCDCCGKKYRDHNKEGENCDTQDSRTDS